MESKALSPTELAARYADHWNNNSGDEDLKSERPKETIESKSTVAPESAPLPPDACPVCGKKLSSYSARIGHMQTRDEAHAKYREEHGIPDYNPPKKSKGVSRPKGHKHYALQAIHACVNQTSDTDTNHVSRGKIYNEYLEICAEKSLRPKGYTQFWKYTRQLEQDGEIQIDIVRDGNGNRGMITLTNPPPAQTLTKVQATASKPESDREKGELQRSLILQAINHLINQEKDTGTRAFPRKKVYDEYCRICTENGVKWNTYSVYWNHTVRLEHEGKIEIANKGQGTTSMLRLVGQPDSDDKLGSIPKYIPKDIPTSRKTVSQKIIDALPEVGLGLICGDMRQEKSCLGYGILEEKAKGGKTCYVVGLPEERRHLLPDTIKTAAGFDEVPPDSIVLVDEAYLIAHARRALSKANVEADKLAGLAGQNRLLIVYITQQARKLDVGLAGGANFILWKKPSLLSQQFERPQLRKMSQTVYKAFGKLPDGEVKASTYIYSSDFKGMVRCGNVPPSFWTEELSEAFQGIPLDADDQTQPANGGTRASNGTHATMIMQPDGTVEVTAPPKHLAQFIEIAVHQNKRGRMGKKGSAAFPLLPPGFTFEIYDEEMTDFFYDGVPQEAIKWAKEEHGLELTVKQFFALAFQYHISGALEVAMDQAMGCLRREDAWELAPYITFVNEKTKELEVDTASFILGQQLPLAAPRPKHAHELSEGMKKHVHRAEKYRALAFQALQETADAIRKTPSLREILARFDQLCEQHGMDKRDTTALGGYFRDLQGRGLVKISKESLRPGGTTYRNIYEVAEAPQ